MKFCNSLVKYSRFNTREVTVGEVGIGGKNPIRIQSMTTTNTLDTTATVEQSIRMIDAGCELVRITAPSKNEAENLANIKAELQKRGYKTPLVADIHFTPNAAEIAARIVEKVRVNPGNYADKKKFDIIEYSDELYSEEIDRIREKFSPLVKICKEYGTAMRIGTNHGSLSDRILSRYGDTPLGMVESAFEFIRFCRELDYHNLVISMKASNTQVMVQAYRLLVSKMIELDWNYPLHLGVTEAGDGEDGRIKSAVGIGTLLEDGLGDTVRVSLTEDPEFEIPVARKLVEQYTTNRLQNNIIEPDFSDYNPFESQQKTSIEVQNIGLKHVPVVVGDCTKTVIDSPAKFFRFGYNYSVPLDKWNIADQACDYVYVGSEQVPFELPGTLRLIQNYSVWNPASSDALPLYDIDEFLVAEIKSKQCNFIVVNSHDVQKLDLIKASEFPVVIVVNADSSTYYSTIRSFCISLKNRHIHYPVIAKIHVDIDDIESMQIKASSSLGGLLLDSLIDGIWITTPYQKFDSTVTATAFGIAQATRTRISKTEYISCPSCGRTLFDLQETTAKIRSVTSHLKGVKIGIMGCIVNGPGEMADADYGYVGSGPGKITLYKGKEVVQKSIPTTDAVDALIELIKQGGDWKEPV